MLQTAVLRVLTMVLTLAAGPALAQERTVFAYGDSLLAGYGLGANEGFVAQMQAALEAEGIDDVTLENVSVSGDTTAMGLARLDWALGTAPDAVLLGLGANDMLQGLPVAEVEANLRAILDRLTAADIEVMLFGMMANRGLGAEYVEAFDGLYRHLADDYGLPLYPFFLEGVAGVANLNQPDRIHPNADGVARIVEQLTPAVADFLAD